MSKWRTNDKKKLWVYRTILKTANVIVYCLKFDIELTPLIGIGLFSIAQKHIA